jgi:hypothetical protein
VSNDLIAWFREQLDQDEALARGIEAFGSPTEWCNPAMTAFIAAGRDRWAPIAAMRQLAAVFEPRLTRVGDADRAMAAHIARWDPAAVLADIAAKRAVLDLRDEWHENLRAWQVPEGQTRPEHLIAAQGWYQALTHAVALLAQPYAGRPGFDPAWRVT